MDISRWRQPPEPASNSVSPGGAAEIREDNSGAPAGALSSLIDIPVADATG